MAVPGGLGRSGFVGSAEAAVGSEGGAVVMGAACNVWLQPCAAWCVACGI